MIYGGRFEAGEQKVVSVVMFGGDCDPVGLDQVAQVFRGPVTEANLTARPRCAALQVTGLPCGIEGLDAASARRLVGSEMLIGRSVHSVDGAVKAESSGADFLVLGTIFDTASHPGADTGGLNLVRDVTDRVGIPVIGIGGISESNVAGLVKSGAVGGAVITAVSMAADPKAASLNIRETMRHAYSCVAELRL